MLKLKLQRFADGALNTQTTTTSSLTAEMKTFYHDTLIDNAEPNLVHMQFGDDYQIPKHGGKTIEMRKYAPLAKAMTALTEGESPAGGALSVSTITATLAQYGYYVTISDILEYAAIDNNIAQATKLLGSQSGRTLDALCRNELVGGTNVLYAPKNASGALTEVTDRNEMDATCLMTPDLIYKAATQLKGKNCDPINGYYVAIIHPYVAYDLMRHEEWIDAHKYAAVENLFTGELGRIGKVRFVESTEAKIWNDSTCPYVTGSTGDKLSVFATLVFGEHAYGKVELEGMGLEHIVHDRKQEGGPLEQRSTVGWKAMAVTKRLTEEYMVRIETVCSFNKSVVAN